jgi:hypothetical protein
MSARMTACNPTSMRWHTRLTSIPSVNYKERENMGFDVAMVQFLCCAKSLGVDFSETLTIGRQQIHDDTRSFAAALSAIGIRDEEISAIQNTEYAESLLGLMGATHISSMDASDYEHATYVCDLNEPCPPDLSRKFSLVLDGGTLEHVFNLPQALKNCMEMVRVGGHFVQVTAANNFMGHGFWQLSPEAIYRVFSPKNGFLVRAVFLREVMRDDVWYQVTDPANYGRVQLVNRRPTYICTIARRLTEEIVFAAWPQQSDYVEMWEGAGATQKHLIAAKPISGTLRATLPPPIRKVLRAGMRGVRDAFGKTSPSFDRPYYRYVSADDLVRGRFGDGNKALQQEM